MQPQVDSGEDDFLPPLQNRQQQMYSLHTNDSITKMTKNAVHKLLINEHLDPLNQAPKYHTSPLVKNSTFNHFMTKNKHVHEKKEIFPVLRHQLSQKGVDTISVISDKKERQTMVVRFISKTDTPNVIIIEDEHQKEKILVSNAIVWQGLICGIEATWGDNIYRLQRIIDLSQPLPNRALTLRRPLMAYRILFLKGPFWPEDDNEKKGLQILDSQLQRFQEDRLRIDCFVVMGPLLSVNNQLVKNSHLERTFQQEFQDIVVYLQKTIKRFYSEAEIVLVPSVEDVTHYHPYPQPAYDIQLNDSQLNFTSNPGVMSLEQDIQFNFINEDLLRYIDDHKVGKASQQLLQENLETYLKQPFYMSNTTEAPFDETNLCSLYNRGQFGDVIVISSKYSQPYAKKVKGRLFVNIGALNIDYQYLDQHFLTLMSVYSGEGDAAERVKVQSYAIK